MSEPTEVVVWETFIAGDGDGGLRTRPATVSELVAALQEEGGQVVEWCKSHDSSMIEGINECGVGYLEWQEKREKALGCVPVSVLVVRIEGEK